MNTNIYGDFQFCVSVPLNRNRNLPAAQNTGNKRPSVVINKHPERQTNFSRSPVVPGTKLFCEASSLPSKRHFDIYR